VKDEMFKEADSLARNDRTEKIAELLQYVSSAVLALGGLLSSLMGGVAVEHRFERVANFLMKLTIEVHRLDGVSDEYIRSEDFEDIFSETLTRAAKERSDEKRAIFGTFLKSAIARQVSYEEYLQARIARFLEDLLPADFVVLSAFAQGPGTENSMSPMQTVQQRTNGLTKDQVIEIVEHLNRLGLLSIDRNGLMVMMTAQGALDLEHWLTPVGRRFLSHLR